MLTVAVSTEPPPAVGDRSLLERVLVNVVDYGRGIAEPTKLTSLADVTTTFTIALPALGEPGHAVPA